MERFTSAQRRMLFLCFLCYSAAYTGRLNLSASLPGLRAELLLSETQSGLFQTLLALVYAAGQIVNGALADRVSARRSIGIGLLLSAACNAAFGLSHRFGLMAALWALNGAAQSMLWTPIVGMTAAWFSGKQRERASFVLSVTVIFGHLAAWALSGLLASALNWRFSFLAPAGVMAAVGAAALLLLRDKPSTATAAREARGRTPGVPLHRLLLETGLAALLLCCVCNGFVRDGVVAWAPTILALGQDGTSVSSTLLSLLIPLINLSGVLLVRRCYRLLRGGARPAVGALLLVSGAMALALVFLNQSAAMRVTLMGLCCAANYGLVPLINTLIPMEYEAAGRVGLVAGLADCFIHLGSALAGVLTGALSDAAGWQGVYILWAAVSFAGALFAAASIRGGRRLQE